MFPRILIIIALFLVIACSSEKGGSKESKEAVLRQIEVYSARKNIKEASLSDYAKSIKYVQIDNSQLVESVVSLQKDGEHMAMINLTNDHSSRAVFLLDNNGNLIRKIGSPGSGPGEFFNPSNLLLFPESEIIILADNRGVLFKYDYNGNYLDKVEVSSFSSPMIRLTDSSFALFKIDNYDEKGTSLITIFNLDLEVIKTLDDRSRYKHIYVPMNSWGSFYTSGLGIHYWVGFTDYSFVLKRNMDLLPENHINFGDAQLTDKIRYSLKEPEYFDYEYLTSSVCVGENTFLSYYDRGDHYYIIHNSEKELTGSLGIVNEFPYNGLTNDIDGGISFFPDTQLAGSIYYTVLNPIKLLEHKAELIRNAKENGIDTDNEFFRLLESVDENDNPIIMLVEFK